MVISLALRGSSVSPYFTYRGIAAPYLDHDRRPFLLDPHTRVHAYTKKSNLPVSPFPAHLRNIRLKSYIKTSAKRLTTPLPLPSLRPSNNSTHYAHAHTRTHTHAHARTHAGSHTQRTTTARTDRAPICNAPASPLAPTCRLGTKSGARSL